MHSTYYSHCATYYSLKSYFLISERSRIKERETGTSQKWRIGFLEVRSKWLELPSSLSVSLTSLCSVLSSPKNSISLVGGIELDAMLHQLEDSKAFWLSKMCWLWNNLADYSHFFYLCIILNYARAKRIAYYSKNYASIIGQALAETNVHIKKCFIYVMMGATELVAQFVVQPVCCKVSLYTAIL